MKINKLNNRGIAINIIKKNTEKKIFLKRKRPSKLILRVTKILVFKKNLST